MKSLSNRLLPTLAAGALSLTAARATITVNSISDVAAPPAGVVTLRSALELAASGEPIVFAPSLDGAVITLSIVAEEHSPLTGEVMGIEDTPSGPISFLIGYFERDYGRSALYARKDVVLDASALTNGVTIAWGGGDDDPARVLALHGDLTLRNISITGGRSEAMTPPETIDGLPQDSTRARGGAIAVWGVAKIENCRLFNNACVMPSTIRDDNRDSGVFGGAIYANIVEISDSVISGNALSGAGVSGGGVFTVGGAKATEEVSTIKRSVISGNRIDGIFAYGGGVYSDGGGIGNLKTLKLENCTIAENRVGISGPPFLWGSGYWRGGGVYMSNGHLKIRGCTIVENETHGSPRVNELSKPNMAGGVAATIGNAHAVETMTIGQSIIAGNTVHEFGGDVYEQDIFTGSLFSFISEGRNRLGVIDFSQILVPIGERDWLSLCRKHYPKVGDRDGVNLANVVDLAEGIARDPAIFSLGVNASNPVAVLYKPTGDAVDQVPAATYSVDEIRAEYRLGVTNNDFLEILLGRVEAHYGLTNFAATFTADFETFLANEDTDPDTEGDQPHEDPNGSPILTLADARWFGPSRTWPSKIYNYPYIEFWHRLDVALRNENIPGMGSELLGDDAWNALFQPGALEENTGITMVIGPVSHEVVPLALDQTGAPRPTNELGDIGAIELALRPAPPPVFQGIGIAGSNVVLRWSGTEDRVYTLWATPSLTTSDWSVVESGVTNTLPVTTNEVPATRARLFYKLEMDPLN